MHLCEHTAYQHVIFVIPLPQSCHFMVLQLKQDQLHSFSSLHRPAGTHSVPESHTARDNNYTRFKSLTLNAQDFL